IQVSVPSQPSSTNVVKPNFLGISFELSFMTEYFGNDTSTVPSAMMNYLSALRSRTQDTPLLVRVGGNSMDSSWYVPDQGSPMVSLIGGPANANNQPVTYGPMLWAVMDKVASDLGGANYLVGLSLLQPNSSNISTLAGAAQQGLGDNLDSFLLGNEPDLYTSHGNRPSLKNYTLQDYIDEFRIASSHLSDTSAGNVLDKHNLGGPTICCNWNLDAVLNGGYLANFRNILKYISMQHYPQNNCFGSIEYQTPYYVQHANVVSLASWQQSGIAVTTSGSSPPLIMSEFNSASCGGIPGISDTFAVGSLWTINYALQLASVGYSAAYVHTRERGVSYNLVAPPDGPNGGPGAWTTNPPYYALLVVPEVLHSNSNNGSIVVDLNIDSSRTDTNSTVGGYAIYDAKDASVQQIMLFNFANSSVSGTSDAMFSLPSSAFNGSERQNVTVKYLAAAHLEEKFNISWGGQTLAGVGDGKLITDDSASWIVPNKQVDCTSGCTIEVPPSALGVIF
ncbi:hypothetical protein BDQ17DRAFT_1223908, partial [Cyathus striatus]